MIMALNQILLLTYLLSAMTDLRFPFQPQSTAAVCLLVLISRPAEGRRLSCIVSIWYSYVWYSGGVDWAGC